MPHGGTAIDVLIVGAGPVGLFLANECARRDLKYRIVEARSSQSVHSKALAVFPRTLEILDMAGVVAPFLDVANRVTSVSIVSRGHRLAHMRFAPEESPYPFVAMVPQDVTERLLLDQLRNRGGNVAYDIAFVSALQHENYVDVTLDHKGEREETTASFVVGCDGAHSTVRHVLELPFEGAEYEQLFLLADIDTTGTLPADELQLCPSELGPVAIFPMSPSRRRVVATIQNPEGDAPSLQSVQDILTERGPGNIEARSLHWSSYFRIHHRLVSQLRINRIFVAGDSAHIHSPFGGQGMNTGLHDVWNLAWKLDLVLRGSGSEELLESYTAERLPVIRQVIETTHFLTRALGTPSKFAQALRDTVIPLVSRLAPFQHAFVQRLSELGIDYHGSPIIEGPGKRYLDQSLRGGSGILRRFILFLPTDVDSSTRQLAKQVAESRSDVVELRYASQGRIFLVRPDGYIAFSASASGGNTALQSIRTLLERQTKSGATTSTASRVA